jgi:hypothetical protein
MPYVIVLLVLAAAIFVISGPLRAASTLSSEPAASSRVPELEAARAAKYAEIREAELDHRTGKLSDEDYHAVDGALRGEAIEILRDLDRSEATPAATIPDA